MSSISKKQNQIHFKAVETPTAWVVLAFAWKIVDGSVVYSEPHIVQVVQKPGSALSGNKTARKAEVLLIAGAVAAKQLVESAIPSPYAFEYFEERSGLITWFGALPPPAFSCVI